MRERGGSRSLVDRCWVFCHSRMALLIVNERLERRLEEVTRGGKGPHLQRYPIAPMGRQVLNGRKRAVAKSGQHSIETVYSKNSNARRWPERQKEITKKGPDVSLLSGVLKL